MNVFKKLWRAEPVIVGVFGNVAFWPTVFGVANMTGHPVDPQTQKVLINLSAIATAGAIRQTVTAPDTLDDQLASIKKVNP